ncbi:DUF4430 domain-containing protein [Faecalitalea cylindroides]|uniref:DUF4430 domain-containing protein n=1 Tax=Faecalitalea cylindroides TaxID=39483 RepID=UPI0018985675|nr:DUF4430 domain-containing protein [Faecalitalea cylindroides]MDB7947219.1 DUF4430 domain-containing protein [Faecalitalea cylindroides]MDB7949078.1 DUF4430 domain-containing protein [Faecalitalea cylindroides]MDB7950962.1 DUF4430 domain-containing protein [Faecalitalea cylindroides]
MKKNILLMGLCTGMILTGCASQSDTESSIKEVSLDIVVKDEVNDKELFNETLTKEGDIENLYDFLSECDELEVVFEDGSYGATIDSMLGLKQDFDKGPWWLYSSENNETCKEEGMCPAVQNLEINDGDQFVFSYTNEF